MQVTSSSSSSSKVQITKFEDILSWQKAFKLSEDVYREMKSCKDYGFRDQIQRSVVSIMNNIAEGYERQSNKDFAHFLYIAKGSCGETRSMVLLGAKLGYISAENQNKYYNELTETAKLLSGLIKKLSL